MTFLKFSKHLCVFSQLLQVTDIIIITIIIVVVVVVVVVVIIERSFIDFFRVLVKQRQTEPGKKIMKIVKGLSALIRQLLL